MFNQQLRTKKGRRKENIIKVHTHVVTAYNKLKDAFKDELILGRMETARMVRVIDTLDELHFIYSKKKRREKANSTANV